MPNDPTQALRRQNNIMDISNIKRILIVRTDRVGDVIVSTPVITAARSAFPNAYIAFMVSPETKEIVAQNPYLNEVIVYDKKSKHRGIFQTLRFARWLRAKRFDLALILHSTVRVNIVSFLAGIPKRVGYRRGKMDFLLTDGLPYKKRFGEKHESEYSLDVLRSLGIDAETSPLVMPIKKEDEKNIDNLLRECGLKEGERFVVINPGASCNSRIWPSENFAKVADILIERFGIKVILVSSPNQVQMKIGERVRALMKNKPLFLCGRTSLGEMAALFKKASLLVSNDSGPVHIASAVGTPLISIFGRKEKGLSPTRWRGLGPKSITVHKDVGCIECLAHNCKKGFLCLRSISAEDIIEKARDLLS